MEKKKILIVGNMFYPINSPRSFRTTELAKEFAFQGHDVTVIIANRDAQHEEFSKNHKIKIKYLGERRFKPVKIPQGGIRRFLARFLVRFFNLVFLYPEIEIMFLVNRSLRAENDQYDLLITIAAPHPIHWGTAFALKRNKTLTKKWIADCGDPFMGSENDSFAKLFYFKYLEKFFCRRADFITVPIEEAIVAYYEEFREKIKVISQGFKFEDVRILESSKPNKIPTFAYAGSLIPGIRDPQEFFNFLCESDLEYHFLIYTKNTSYAKKYEKLSKGRIEVHDSLPRFELLDLLQTMDFVVNFENKGARQSPSKLIDYVIINKPILTIRTFGFQSDVFNEFIKGDFSNRLIIKNPDQYRIENVCQKFINLAY